MLVQYNVQIYNNYLKNKKVRDLVGYPGKYKISKFYSNDLRHKANVFKTNTRKAVFPVMITTKGLLDNPYARDNQGQVVMEEMFE